MSQNIKKYLFGLLIGIAATVICILALAAVMLIGEIDKAFAVPFATISVGFGGFIGSLITSKKIGDKGYLVGTVIGGILFVVILFVSLVINKDGLTTNTLFHFIIIMLASITGGIVGVNKSKKKYI